MAAARATLDKNRPFGMIYGDGADGACYEQDHKRFDGAGNEIVTEQPVAPTASKPAGKKAAEPTGTPAGQPPLVQKDANGNIFKAGQIVDLQALEVEELHALAKDMGLTLHPQTGATKAIAKIVEAAPLLPAGDQLDQQLNG